MTLTRMHKHALLPLAVALTGCGTTSTAELTTTTVTTPAPVVRTLHGPVELSVTAALIAPGKDSGLPWDGPGSLTREVAEVARRGLSRDVQRSLLGRLPAYSAPIGALIVVAPEVASALQSAYEPPDVRIVIKRNGQRVHATRVVQDSFGPTWAEVFSGVEIGPTDYLEFEAVDADLMFDDAIGVCTVQGTPQVDGDGYVVPDAYRCNGQLWGIVVRMRELVGGIFGPR